MSNTTNTKTNEKPATTVTLMKDHKWTPVGGTVEGGKGFYVTMLYGDLETKAPTNFLMRYSAGVSSPPHTHTGDYYCTVVSGKIKHYLEDKDEYEVLGPGSTWFQKGGVVHQETCLDEEDAVLCVYWPNGFDVQMVDTCANDGCCAK